MKKIYRLRKEVFIFTLIGITAVLIDISTYIIFVSLTKLITFSKFIVLFLGLFSHIMAIKNLLLKQRQKRLLLFSLVEPI